MIKTTGFYRGVAHHDPHLARGDIREQVTTDDAHTRRLVASYLAGGGRVAASPGSGMDVFGSRRRVSMDVLSDGEWVWPEDAAFYCERYGILPDTALMTKALNAHGACPEVPADLLIEIGRELHAPYDGREVV